MNLINTILKPTNTIQSAQPINKNIWNKARCYRLVVCIPFRGRGIRHEGEAHSNPADWRYINSFSCRLFDLLCAMCLRKREFHDFERACAPCYRDQRRRQKPNVSCCAGLGLGERDLECKCIVKGETCHVENTPCCHIFSKLEEDFLKLFELIFLFYFVFTFVQNQHILDPFHLVKSHKTQNFGFIAPCP